MKGEYTVTAAQMHMFKTTPPLARKSDGQNSADAAAKVCANISKREAQVLAVLTDFPMGATTYEMAATGRILHSVCEKRMAGLERKGLVWRIWQGFSDSGRALYESRKNENGNLASVWRKR